MYRTRTWSKATFGWRVRGCYAPKPAPKSGTARACGAVRRHVRRGRGAPLAPNSSGAAPLEPFVPGNPRRAFPPARRRRPRPLLAHACLHVHARTHSMHAAQPARCGESSSAAAACGRRMVAQDLEQREHGFVRPQARHAAFFRQRSGGLACWARDPGVTSAAALVSVSSFSAMSARHERFAAGRAEGVITCQHLWRLPNTTMRFVKTCGRCA